MGRADYLYNGFISNLKFEPTRSQDSFFRTAADFLCGDDDDILVVNGYAGTGKTTAVSSIIRTLGELKIKTVLLAPTGRAAKVLSGYAGRAASTVHKHIYRQKAVSGDGFGEVRASGASGTRVTCAGFTFSTSSMKSSDG